MQTQVKCTLDLFIFDFWLIYYKKTLNFSNNLLYKLDSQRNTIIKILLFKILFFIIIAIISQLILFKKKKLNLY